MSSHLSAVMRSVLHLEVRNVGTDSASCTRTSSVCSLDRNLARLVWVAEACQRHSLHNRLISRCSKSPHQARLLMPCVRRACAGCAWFPGTPAPPERGLPGSSRRQPGPAAPRACAPGAGRARAGLGAARRGAGWRTMILGTAPLSRSQETLSARPGPRAEAEGALARLAPSKESTNCLGSLGFNRPFHFCTGI